MMQRARSTPFFHAAAAAIVTLNTIKEITITTVSSANVIPRPSLAAGDKFLSLPILVLMASPGPHPLETLGRTLWQTVPIINPFSQGRASEQSAITASIA